MYDDRHWRVRGLERNHSLERLKVNLRVTRDELFHVNLFDLYSASGRRGYIREAASELYVPEELIKRDLAMFLTTTAERPDAELENRCLVLRANESAAQTAAIHAMRRARYTLAGREQLTAATRSAAPIKMPSGCCGLTRS